MSCIQLHSMSFAKKGQQNSPSKQTALSPTPLHSLSPTQQDLLELRRIRLLPCLHPHNDARRHASNTWPNTILDWSTRPNPKVTMPWPDVVWSEFFGITARSPSGKNVPRVEKKFGGIATKPAGDPIQPFGTWKENCFPPTWRVGFGNVTYLVIPRMLLASHAGSLHGSTKKVFVSTSTSVTLFFTSCCHHTVMRPGLQKTRKQTHFEPDSTLAGVEATKWRKACKNALLAAANPAFEKCTTEHRRAMLFSWNFQAPSPHRKNGEDASARSAQVCVWLAARRWKMRGKSCPCKAPVSGPCFVGGRHCNFVTPLAFCPPPTLQHLSQQVDMRQRKVSNHSGFPTWFLRLHRPRQRFQFWERLLQFQLAWLIPADLADSFLPW